jgi:hypothetical protein
MSSPSSDADQVSREIQAHLERIKAAMAAPCGPLPLQRLVAQNLAFFRLARQKGATWKRIARELGSATSVPVRAGSLRVLVWRAENAQGALVSLRSPPGRNREPVEPISDQVRAGEDHPRRPRDGVRREQDMAADRRPHPSQPLPADLLARARFLRRV